MLGISRTALFQVLSKLEGEHQQHTNYPERGNSWTCEKEDAQDKCRS